MEIYGFVSSTLVLFLIFMDNKVLKEARRREGKLTTANMTLSLVNSKQWEISGLPVGKDNQRLFADYFERTI